MLFRHYNAGDYEALCDFFIALNEGDKKHINWNWARFEWMYRHPEFDGSRIDSFGLWTDGEKIVGAAVYDMYFGEGFCGALPGYKNLYPEILDYACRELRDDAGFAFAVCDDDKRLAETAAECGFEKFGQWENIMAIRLDREYRALLPEGLTLAELDPSQEPYDFQWVLWQGFDHGNDRAEFEADESFVPEIGRLREHFNPRLSMTAVNEAGEKVAYCCLWYNEKTDYAYVEPVCVIPAYRGQGVAKAVIYEALDRARLLGAKNAYVISDMAFYKKLGFEDFRHYTFWRRQQD